MNEVSSYVRAPYKGLGAESEEKREPVSDIDTGVVDSLKVLDPDRPIREADIDLIKIPQCNNLPAVGCLDQSLLGASAVPDRRDYKAATPEPSAGSLRLMTGTSLGRMS
jgi:hypothetical protein